MQKINNKIKTKQYLYLIAELAGDHFLEDAGVAELDQVGFVADDVLRRDVVQELDGLGADPVADGALVKTAAPAPRSVGLHVGQKLVDVNKAGTFCHFNIFGGFIWIG